MGIGLRFRMRWVLHSAALFLAASLALLFSLRAVLNRGLGHDYARGFWTLNGLESTLQIAVGVPLLAYLVLVSAAVAVFKVFISHKIAGPICRLERCASAFARGDFTFVTRLRRGDELNGLAGSVGALRDRGAAQVEVARKGAARVRAVLDGIERLDESQYQQSADELLARLEGELATFAQQLLPGCGRQAPG